MCLSQYDNDFDVSDYKIFDRACLLKVVTLSSLIRRTTLKAVVPY
jgi:hypothetical protein